MCPGVTKFSKEPFLSVRDTHQSEVERESGELIHIHILGEMNSPDLVSLKEMVSHACKNIEQLFQKLIY